LYFKVLFMIPENQHLEAIQDIRKMMQRSSRFISLSGLSGIAAGFWALAGAAIAYTWINEYYGVYKEYGYTGTSFDDLKNRLFLLAIGVLGLSLFSAFYFTWRKTEKDKVTLWNHTSKLMTINMIIPLVSGGIFILTMLQYDEWRFVAPASLIFYGLALVNASKYTLSEIRYLGLLQIVLGLINTQFINSGLYFWAIGFGLLHILYGFSMWWKYERNPITSK
jgi:hypothetical protein